MGTLCLYLFGIGKFAGIISTFSQYLIALLRSFFSVAWRYLRVCSLGLLVLSSRVAMIFSFSCSLFSAPWAIIGAYAVFGEGRGGVLCEQIYLFIFRVCECDLFFVFFAWLRGYRCFGGIIFKGFQINLCYLALISMVFDWCIIHRQG